MARIPEITSREELPQDKQHIFDAIAESRGRIVGPFALLSNSPELAGRTAHLGKVLAKVLDVKVGDSLELQTEARSNVGEVAGFVSVAPHQPSAQGQDKRNALTLGEGCPILFPNDGCCIAPLWQHYTAKLQYNYRLVATKITA